MKEKSNENHLPKVVGIHEHLLKKESGVKVIPLDSSNGKWDFQSARILKMSTSIRHKVHSKKRTVRMDIVCKTPLPILATALYIWSQVGKKILYMYQPCKGSDILKWFWQNIFEKKIFLIFFYLYFARVQNGKKRRARGAQQKYDLDRPKLQNPKA